MEAMLKASQKASVKATRSFAEGLSCTGHCAALFPFTIFFKLTCFFEVQRNRCMLLGQPVIYLTCGLITTSPSASPGRTNTVPGILGSFGMLPNEGSKRHHVRQPIVRRGAFASHLHVGKRGLGCAVLWLDRKWHDQTPRRRKWNGSNTLSQPELM